MQNWFNRKMGRRHFIKAGLGVLGAATLGFPKISRSAEKFKLKFATQEPGHSLFNKAYWLWWCDRVEQLSAGAVKFDRFPGEVLVKGADIYEACRDGVIQSGNFLIPYESGQIPLPTVKELPFSFVNFETHLSLWRKFMEAGLNDYLHSFGIQVVSDMSLTPYGFWTSKKWGPIRRLEDVKGCKVRSPGGYMSRALEAMGAIPINMPSPEAYTAMERGTLDCISMVESSQIAFRLHEVTAFITRADYSTTGVPIMVNLKVWNSLPKEIQEIMLQAGKEAEQNIIKEMMKYQKEVVDPTIQKRGIKVTALPESERERMKKACAPVWDEWLAKNGSLFNGLGKKMFDIVLKTVGKP